LALENTDQSNETTVDGIIVDGPHSNEAGNPEVDPPLMEESPESHQEALEDLISVDDACEEEAVLLVDEEVTDSQPEQVPHETNDSPESDPVEEITVSESLTVGEAVTLDSTDKPNDIAFDEDHHSCDSDQDTASDPISEDEPNLAQVGTREVSEEEPLPSVQSEPANPDQTLFLEERLDTAQPTESHMPDAHSSDSLDGETSTAQPISEKASSSLGYALPTNDSTVAPVEQTTLQNEADAGAPPEAFVTGPIQGSVATVIPESAPTIGEPIIKLPVECEASPALENTASQVLDGAVTTVEISDVPPIDELPLPVDESTLAPSDSTVPHVVEATAPSVDHSTAPPGEEQPPPFDNADTTLAIVSTVPEVGESLAPPLEACASSKVNEQLSLPDENVVPKTEEALPPDGVTAPKTEKASRSDDAVAQKTEEIPAPKEVVAQKTEETPVLEEITISNNEETLVSKEATAPKTEETSVLEEVAVSKNEENTTAPLQHLTPLSETNAVPTVQPTAIPAEESVPAPVDSTVLLTEACVVPPPVDLPTVSPVDQQLPPFEDTSIQPAEQFAEKLPSPGESRKRTGSSQSVHFENGLEPGNEGKPRSKSRSKEKKEQDTKSKKREKGLNQEKERKSAAVPLLKPHKEYKPRQEKSSTPKAPKEDGKKKSEELKPKADPGKPILLGQEKKSTTKTTKDDSKRKSEQLKSKPSLGKLDQEKKSVIKAPKEEGKKKSEAPKSNPRPEKQILPGKEKTPTTKTTNEDRKKKSEGLKPILEPGRQVSLDRETENPVKKVGKVKPVGTDDVGVLGVKERNKLSPRKRSFFFP
jgi:hypothetical protein